VVVDLSVSLVLEAVILLVSAVLHVTTDSVRQTLVPVRKEDVKSLLLQPQTHLVSL
jgi:hypothetical protein